MTRKPSLCLRVSIKENIHHGRIAQNIKSMWKLYNFLFTIFYLKLACSKYWYWKLNVFNNISIKHIKSKKFSCNLVIDPKKTFKIPVVKISHWVFFDKKDTFWLCWGPVRGTASCPVLYSLARPRLPHPCPKTHPPPHPHPLLMAQVWF